MLDVDPWSMTAAEWDRAIELVADPDRRIVLNSLRSFWIALGNDFVCERDGADQRFANSRIKKQLAVVARYMRN